MNDCIINLDSKKAKEFGFTSDKFDGYLWDKGDCIWISLIISLQEGRGNVRKLIGAIAESGYIVKVPVPFARMQNICERMGFHHTSESDCEDVWVLPVKKTEPRA